MLNAPSYPEVLLDLFHVVVVGQGGGSCTERRGIAIMIFCLSCAVLFSARECSIGNIAITAKTDKTTSPDFFYLKINITVVSLIASCYIAKNAAFEPTTATYY